MSLRAELEAIFPKVDCPGRYIGNEPNQVVKDLDTIIADIVLTFPDSYELGMSHQGTRILYHAVNREEHLYAERCFAPKPDMAQQLRSHNIPLYSLETYRALSAFTAIGISLQTELNFTNVPFILELGGINAYSKSRGNNEPFVIGGGACMANPEPVADFFDVLVIGDGETVLPHILRVMGEGRAAGITRQSILEQVSAVQGVYVPCLFSANVNNEGFVIPGFKIQRSDKTTGKVKRIWQIDLEPENSPSFFPIPNVSLIHNRLAIEVMRGCTQGCRFCQAGYWYRPVREVPIDFVIEQIDEGLKASGERELGLLSLSSADYSQIEPLTDYLAGKRAYSDINLSLPSLRASSFSRELAGKVQALGGSNSITFAPECGSDRLRRVINKHITDEDLIKSAESAFKSGFNKIKLYSMVGFPTETLEDMQALGKLVEKIAEIGKEYNRKNSVHLHIGILVPKPFTPMQWCEFVSRENASSHIYYVRDYLRRVPKTRVTWSDWNTACVESFLARGDRSVSTLIYKAYKAGEIFETFTENFDFSIWETLWQEQNYTFGKWMGSRGLKSDLPWDVIDSGIKKTYLAKEYEKMFAEPGVDTPDCKWGDCQGCGIPGNYKDIKLSPKSTLYQQTALTLEEISKLGKFSNKNDKEIVAYIIEYKKKDFARFLPHLAVMAHFEKSFRRLDVKLQYSQGFNPRVVFKNPGALPLGMESECEILMIQTRGEIIADIDKLYTSLNDILPSGIVIVSVTKAGSLKLPRVKAVTYCLYNFGGGGDLTISGSSDHTVTNRKGKTIDLSKSIVSVCREGENIKLTAQTNASGSTPSPYLLYAEVLHITEQEARNLDIRKICLHYE